MSWTTGQCECGDTVDYGIYYSEHEDELSEVNVTVLCGECVRERDGIPSIHNSHGDKIVDEDFKLFESEVEKHGLRNAINWDSTTERQKQYLETSCIMYESYEGTSENWEGTPLHTALVKGAWSLLNP